MASETKIGLLAGSAFIVCFAVILTSQDKRASNHPLFLSDTSGELQPRALPAPAENSWSIADINSYAGASDYVDTIGYKGTNPDDGPTTGSEVILYDTHDDADSYRNWDSHSRFATHTFDVSPDAENTTDPLDNHRARLTSETRPRSLTTDGLARQFGVSPRSASINDTSPSNGYITHTAPPGLSSTSADGGAYSVSNGLNRQTTQKYTVQAGDTLYAIAQRHYAAQSHNTIEAIIRANQPLLSDPDVLHVGDEIILPDLPHPPGSSGSVKESSREPFHPQPLNTGQPATSYYPHQLKPLHQTNPSNQADPPYQLNPDDKSFQWYQIKKGDRYASIARKILGDASRWRELFELNKDRFPNADQIREGVLIRIPKSISMIALPGSQRSRP